MRIGELAAGDIGLISYPNADGSGDEVRPVLVLITGPVGWREDEVVVIAEITADEIRVANPLMGDLPIDEWDKDTCNLNYPSLARCRQIRSFSPVHILHVLGRVDDVTLIKAQRLALELFTEAVLPQG